MWTEDTWTNVLDFKVKIDYVHQQLRHMDDTSFRGGLECKIQIGHYSFPYNGEMDSAPDPGHSVEDFKFGKFVAVVTILTFTISDLGRQGLYSRFSAQERWSMLGRRVL